MISNLQDFLVSFPEATQHPLHSVSFEEAASGPDLVHHREDAREFQIAQTASLLLLL